MQLEPRDRTPSSAPLKAPTSGDETALQPALRCGVCEAVVADPKDRVERFGSHVQERVNPGGFTFVIGCFSRAEGVMEVGEESDCHDRRRLPRDRKGAIQMRKRFRIWLLPRGGAHGEATHR